MNISLLHIVVPTILVLVVLIAFMNSRNKRIMEQIGGLKAQLDKMEVKPEHVDAPEKIEIIQAEPDTGITDMNVEDEEQDAEDIENSAPEASAYNTGKSGKIYTKEELELLIKE